MTEPTQKDLDELEAELGRDFVAGLEDSMRAYLREIGSIRLMKYEEVIEAAYAAQTEVADLEANDPEHKKHYPHETVTGKRIIEANLRLVVAIAKRYGGPRHVERLDVIQDGNEALIKAVDGFKPERGFKFSTYAAWWIKQGIIKALNGGRAISIPAHQRERERHARAVHNRFMQDKAHEPSLSEMQQEMWIYLLERHTAEFIRNFVKAHGRVPTIKECDKALAAELERNPNALQDYAAKRNIPLDEDEIRDALSLPVTVRLEAPIDGDGNELGDVLAAPETAAPRYDRDDVDTILGPLTMRRPDGQFVYADGPMMAKVLQVRTGIYGEEAKILFDVGKELGLTRERVRQIEELAFARIKKFSNNKRIRELRGE